MTNLDLMELADFSRPFDIVNEILKQNPQFGNKTPLESLAEAAGIREIQYKQLNGLEGALIANPEKSEGIIIINESVIPTRQRFTLGHELGHFLIPRHGHQMNCSLNDLYLPSGQKLSAAQQIEAEANLFSEEILLPKSKFRATKEFRSEPSTNSILELSDMFGVSFKACANRYVKLSDHPVAVVFSKDSVIEYGFRSEEVPFWLRVKKRDQIPINSLTKNYNGSPFSITNDEIDTDIWFDEVKGYEMPKTLIEEVYIQENGYTVTLLWFEEEIEETE